MGGRRATPDPAAAQQQQRACAISSRPRPLAALHYSTWGCCITRPAAHGEARSPPSPGAASPFRLGIWYGRPLVNPHYNTHSHTSNLSLLQWIFRYMTLLVRTTIVNLRFALHLPQLLDPQVPIPLQNHTYHHSHVRLHNSHASLQEGADTNLEGLLFSQRIFYEVLHTVGNSRSRRRLSLVQVEDPKTNSRAYHHGAWHDRCSTLVRMQLHMPSSLREYCP